MWQITWYLYTAQPRHQKYYLGTGAGVSEEDSKTFSGNVSLVSDDIGDSQGNIVVSLPVNIKFNFLHGQPGLEVEVEGLVREKFSQTQHLAITIVNFPGLSSLQVYLGEEVCQAGGNGLVAGHPGGGV